jgi:hypothetical protein
MYIRIRKVAKDLKEMNGGTSYTYTKVKNIFHGFKGTASKKEIQQIRKLLKADFTQIDNILAKLEEQ